LTEVVVRRWKLLVGLALVLVVGTAGWWSFLYEDDRLDAAADLLNAHQDQLDQILAILRANPRLCFVSTGRPLNLNCPSATAARDKIDYATVATLMGEIGIEHISPERWDETEGLVGGVRGRQDGSGKWVFESGATGELIYFEFGVYDESLIPLRYSVVGVWHEGRNVKNRRDCQPLDRPHWYVCVVKNRIFL
jgi:hypothetical protein